jgi:cell division cycle protein 37
MSKPFDYSKWDNIELSDDESDCHPNIEKESWFRMKHRSRVEREETEEADKKKINKESKRDDLRIKELEERLSKMAAPVAEGEEEDLEDPEGMRAEIEELTKANAARQAKLDHYEKNKKWNVDNLSTVVDDKSLVNNAATEATFDASGYALPVEKKVVNNKVYEVETIGGTPSADLPKPPVAAAAAPPAAATTTVAKAVAGPKSENEAMLSYADFTTKYEDMLETWVNMTGMEASKNFLLQNGTVLLQEHGSSYLLLATLEDEMNGEREKMMRTAKQSQILTNIAELAKSLKRHPGNVIIPFFSRLEEESHYKSFQEGVDIFIKRIIERAVVKRKEMESQEQETEEVDLASLPVEDRLGPGGLDPIEVFESLPQVLQEAFESRDMEALHKAIGSLTPQDAQYHMKRCADSGLWNAA